MQWVNGLFQKKKKQGAGGEGGRGVKDILF